MTLRNKAQGFTIVELLIVIVVIGILAAITIVAYNGIQQRATVAAIQSELAQNAKAITAGAAVSPTGIYASVDVMPGGPVTTKFDTSRYKVVTFCATTTQFILAVQTLAGDKYYSKTGAAAVKDNTIDAYRPCDSISIGSALTTYLNLPAVCATEPSTCTFSGTATILYGNPSLGKFTRAVNQTSPITCAHGSLGIDDPASGYQKSCYVYPN